MLIRNLENTMVTGYGVAFERTVSGGWGGVGAIIHYFCIIVIADSSVIMLHGRS